MWNCDWLEAWAIGGAAFIIELGPDAGGDGGGWVVWMTPPANSRAGTLLALSQRCTPGARSVPLEHVGMQLMLRDSLGVTASAVRATARARGEAYLTEPDRRGLPKLTDFVSGPHEALSVDVEAERRRIFTYMRGFAKANCNGGEREMVEEIIDRLSHGDHTKTGPS